MCPGYNIAVACRRMLLCCSNLGDTCCHNAMRHQTRTSVCGATLNGSARNIGVAAQGVGCVVSTLNNR